VTPRFLRNVRLVAVREYRMRVRSRSFVFGTLLLAMIAFGVVQLPVFLQVAFDTGQTRLGVLAPADLPADGRALFEATLNGSGTAQSLPGGSSFDVTWFDPASPGGPDPGDLASAQLATGRLDALLVVERDAATGDLAFTLQYGRSIGVAALAGIEGAARMLVVEDRLTRAGSSLSDVLAPYRMTIDSASGSAGAVGSLANDVSAGLISTGLIVLIFVAIVTYGMWVAVSVAEEKGSRVMELMLNAATPRQMLAGKVIGNGAAGMSQYAVVLAAMGAGMLLASRPLPGLSGSVQSAALGSFTPSILAAFLLLFGLGFVFYALLYAALASLVSRADDVQSATSPLMLLIMLGYLMSILALPSIDADWVRAASYVPFFSPYLLLARVSMGRISPPEFALGVSILVASIGLALLLAARVYSAGVLMYGQRVGIREVFKALRAAR
jgi:ABC-2 type transport system permease protein